jgi:hypothetical protein
MQYLKMQGHSLLAFSALILLGTIAAAPAPIRIDLYITKSVEMNKNETIYQFNATFGSGNPL